MRVWLKYMRENTGLKQEEVASRVGISLSMYAHIEAGTRDPSVHNAKRIGEALNFDWTNFFDDTLYNLKSEDKVGSGIS